MPFSFTNSVQKWKSKQANLVGVGYAYTRFLNIPLTQTSLQNVLEEHPDYPSLLSLSDAFDAFKIENVAAQIDTDQLTTSSPPYIAHLNTNGGQFVLVKNATESGFGYIDENHQQTTISRSDFLQKWAGVVFIAEPNQQAGETDYAKKRQGENLEALRWPLIGLGFLLFVFWGVAQAPTAAVSVWVLLKALGVLLSALLLSVQYGQPNELTASLCKLNNKTDCNHILTSSAAKLTDWLGWSEIGLFYFAGGLLVLTSPQTPDGGFNSPPFADLKILWLLAVLALPYTFWSIYYQWRVAKQWCPLCVAVQVVLWLEAVVGFWALDIAEFNTSIFINSIQMFPLRGVVDFFLPPLIWLIIKPLLLKAKQTDSLKKELRQFKNNPALFEASLRQQRPMPALPADLQPITLGNPAAQHTIVMVTNPYCGPCANAHEQLEQALLANPNLKAEIVFAATNHKDDRRGQVARHLLSLNGSGVCLEALASWYALKDYGTWAKQYPFESNNEAAQQLEIQHNWCTVADIEATPTFFIDGFEKTPTYPIADAGRLLAYSSANLAKPVLR